MAYRHPFVDSDILFSKTFIDRSYSPDLPNPSDSGLSGELLTDQAEANELVPVFMVANRERQQKAGRRVISVIAPAWSDGVGPERARNQQRTEVISDVLKRDVIAIGNPGVDVSAPDMPDSMKNSLWSGNSDPVIDHQWGAIEEALHRLGVDEGGEGLGFSDVDFHLGTYSQGSWGARGLLRRAPEGVTVSQLDLWESPDISRRTFAEIITIYGLYGSAKWKQEMAENPSWVKRSGTGKTLLNQLTTRRAGLVNYPRAMALGPTAEESMSTALDRGTITPDAMISIFNADDSRISPHEDNDELAISLAEMDFTNIRRFHTKGTHAISDNLPFYRHIYQVVNNTPDNPR